MDANHIKDYFSQDGVVCDYARAVLNVGLWESERIVFEEFFNKSDKLLELGCGAGRIAHNLYARGYKNIVSTDFSEVMISVAKAIAEDFNYAINYEVQDATSLTFKDNFFDGAIFGFNGLMQIPKRERRRGAMAEIFRVLKKGSYFAFTTHDREAPRNSAYWQNDIKQWQDGTQHAKLDEFGDICYESEYGELFIHSPTCKEVEEDMASVGFQKIFSKKRAEIAYETQAVQEFSDECIFWVYKKI